MGHPLLYLHVQGVVVRGRVGIDPKDIRIDIGVRAVGLCVLSSQRGRKGYLISINEQGSLVASQRPAIDVYKRQPSFHMS